MSMSPYGEWVYMTASKFTALAEPVLLKKRTQCMRHDSTDMILDFTNERSENVSQLALRLISVFHSHTYGVTRNP
jgi:hypothetical protein